MFLYNTEKSYWWAKAIAAEVAIVLRSALHFKSFHVFLLSSSPPPHQHMVMSVKTDNAHVRLWYNSSTKCRWIMLSTVQRQSAICHAARMLKVSSFQFSGVDTHFAVWRMFLVCSKVIQQICQKSDLMVERWKMISETDRALLVSLFLPCSNDACSPFELP